MFFLLLGVNTTLTGGSGLRTWLWSWRWVCLQVEESKGWGWVRIMKPQAPCSERPTEHFLCPELKILSNRQYYVLLFIAITRRFQSFLLLLLFHEQAGQIVFLFCQTKVPVGEFINQPLIPQYCLKATSHVGHYERLLLRTLSVPLGRPCCGQDTKWQR